VNNLRHELDQWRSHDYPGASDTTRELLNHWFLRDHLLINGEGVPQEFRYYFCQREAIEAFIYLMEVRRLRTLLSLGGGIWRRKCRNSCVRNHRN